MLQSARVILPVKLQGDFPVRADFCGHELCGPCVLVFLPQVLSVPLLPYILAVLEFDFYLDREDSGVRYKTLKGVTPHDLVRLAGNWQLQNHK